MSKVLGKDIVFYILQNGRFIPVACARTCTFTTTTETLGKSTIGSGLFREFKGTVSSGAITVEGLVTFDDNTAVSSLRTYELNLIELNFQFTEVDDGGEGIIYSGILILTSVAETGNYNDVGTYSVQAITTGEIVITSTVGNPDVIYFGTQHNGSDPVDFTRFITGDANNDITINYGHQVESLFYWMAHTIGALQKSNWEDQNDIGNASTIGGATDLYGVRVITINGNDFLLYITRYVTIFNGYEAIVKYYRIPGGCLPPTDLHITNIVNSDADTGRIVTGSTIGTSINYQIFGVFLGGGVFTFSIYGTLVQFTTTAGMSVNAAVLGIIAAINSAAVASLDPPPGTVAAYATDAANGRFAISLGTPPTATAAYLSPFIADITFDFTLPVDPGISYTLRIINTDTSTTVTDTGGAAPRIVSVRRGYNYKFAIRTDCENGSSDWSADLIQFIP